MGPFTPIPLPKIEEPEEYNTNYILYWHHVGLEHNRITHTVGGPQTGPPISARALGMFQLAVHDAYFAINPSCDFTTFLAPGGENAAYRLPDLNGASDARQAVAGASIKMLSELYSKPVTQPNPNLGAKISDNAYEQLQLLLDRSMADAPGVINQASTSFVFDQAVAEVFFNLLFHPPPGASQEGYHPTSGHYRFDDEPTHPDVLIPVDPNNPDGPKMPFRQYHNPFYGTTAKRLVTQTEHMIADPPGIRSAAYECAEYDNAVRVAIAMGGAIGLNSTKRSPYQITQGIYWACDGSNLIGTPPRLYNPIVRRIAVTYKNEPDLTSSANNADFARLLALVNKGKWEFELWRPLSGVRDDGRPSHVDPFFLTLGAPATNTNDIPFKPPFTAYPFGHATFGGAVFQIVRRYYNGRPGLGTWENDEPDSIAIGMMVSEELNSLSRDLRQPYDAAAPITDQPGIVRTRVVRRFSSAWELVFENAISRIFLGVHWRFDAAAARDILILTTTKDVYTRDEDGATVFQNVEDVRYTTMGTSEGFEGLLPVGGVPLGIGIADETFESWLRSTPRERQPVVYSGEGMGETKEVGWGCGRVSRCLQWIRRLRLGGGDSS